MNDFDPVNDVIGSGLILDHGAWPNFHDAEVHELKIWRGEVRPADNVWIGPVIDASFELCAIEHPYLVVLRFHDCESIELKSFNYQNAIYDLCFRTEQRGHLRDGNPLPPFVCVSFEPAFGVRLSFKCMRVEATERRAVR